MITPEMEKMREWLEEQDMRINPEGLTLVGENLDMLNDEIVRGYHQWMSAFRALFAPREG